MLAFSGTPNIIILFLFSVCWQSVYFGNVQAFPHLSPMSLLKLTYHCYCQSQVGSLFAFHLSHWDSHPIHHTPVPREDKLLDEFDRQIQSNCIKLQDMNYLLK